MWIEMLIIVHSTPSCASQPISLHRKLHFLTNLIKYFVNICDIYLVKSLSKSVKWSMQVLTYLSWYCMWIEMSIIVLSAPSCASQPISLHRKLHFLTSLIKYFVNICDIYLVKSLSKSVKWSMQVLTYLSWYCMGIEMSIIVHSTPSCASQPISLHRKLNFWST